MFYKGKMWRSWLRCELQCSSARCVSQQCLKSACQCLSSVLKPPKTLKAAPPEGPVRDGGIRRTKPSSGRQEAPAQSLPAPALARRLVVFWTDEPERHKQRSPVKFGGFQFLVRAELYRELVMLLESQLSLTRSCGGWGVVV